MTKVVIKICNIYVLEIEGNTFIMAPNKDTAKRYSKTVAKRLTEPWKGNVTFEEVNK